MARRLTTESSLTPYVPRVALRWEAEGGGQWREVDGSLVFVDISGFTALSERLARQGRVGAEELTGTLSTCFGELLAVAYEAGGSLLKFGGDALLLLFDGDDHASRACASAVRMRATMADVGRVVTSVGNVRLRMSVGVHSGVLHLFRVGRSHHELIVTGPGASTTVEMESTASAGEIVISPATAAAIDPRLVGAAKGPGRLLRRGPVAVPDTWAVGPVEPLPDAAVSVPVALRDELLTGQLESEHRHASIAFVHFDDVDRMLETDGPAAVAGELDRLVCDAQDAADHHGVTFLATDVDHDGGKIILVAGAPRALGDDEARMLGCLRQIADVDRRLPIRTGVNHGHVFVGTVGPAFRRTYTVMGDAVNLAARLMANAGAGEILATSDVLDRSATEYEATPLPPFMVKGKSQPVTAFAVGAHGARRADDGAARLPFTGRDAELAQVAGALDRAAAGHGGLLDVAGDGGIGKSRLVEELAARADGFTVVRAFCEPYEASTPYYAFGFLLRALAGVRSGGRRGGDELRDEVARRAPALLPWLPLVAAVAGVDVDPTPDTDAIEPRFRRPRTNWAVVQLLETLVTDPTLLIIEDGEWLDALSAELVVAVAKAAAARPWLLCLARRAEEGDAATLGGGAAVSMRLGPLDDGAVHALVSAATSGSPLLPHERDAVVARCGGNPLFLEELLRARSGGAADDPLPDSLEAVVATQIDRLSPADRRLLRYTSVLGVTFDVPLLSAVTDGELRTAAAAVRRLPAFLERAGPGLVRFRNECHRQAAYDALPFGRRRQLHAAVGDALEHAAGTREAERAGTLSFHFLHAQRWDRCWHYARNGAEQARAKYANVEAADLYQRALTAAAHLEQPAAEVAGVWEALGDVAMLAGEFDRTGAAYRRARRLRSGDPLALAHLCVREYRAGMHRGRSATAVRWVRRGLRLLDGMHEEPALSWRAHLSYMLAHSHQQRGRPRQALEWARRALDDAVLSGNRTAQASACLLQDWALMALGRPDEATHSPLALAIAEELDDAARTGEALLYMGNFAQMRGCWNDAHDLWDRACAAYLRAGNTVDAAFGACNSAEILLCQGRYDEAESRLRDALDVWQAMGYSNGQGQALISLGTLTLNRGDVAEATLVFEDARRLFASAGDGRELAALGGLAECRLREGSVEGALELVEDAVRRQALSGDTTFAAMLHRVRAYAYAALDRLDDAWAEVDESLAVARAGGAVYEVALTLEAMSVVAELGGLPPDRSADAERAALLEQLGVQTTPPPPVRVAA